MRRAVVLLLLSLALSGCTDGRPSATREQVVAAADDLCDEAYLELGPGFDLDRRATDANGGVPVGDEDLARLVRSERRFAGEAEDFAGRIEDLAAPEQDERALAEAADGLRAVADALREAADAGEDGERAEHDRAQRVAYEAFKDTQSGYTEHFGRRCGTIGE
jgi:hypothetical protein